MVETFNTTHRIRSYDPMALRLIQKVSVLFAPRAAKEAQSITTSFMHLSLLLPSYVPLPVSASTVRHHGRDAAAQRGVRLYFIIGLVGLARRMKTRHHHHFK